MESPCMSVMLRFCRLLWTTSTYKERYRKSSLMKLEVAIRVELSQMFTEFFLLFQKKAKKSHLSSHVGNPRNEHALAKAATTKDTIECWIPVTIKDIKRLIDQYVLQQWQTKWDDKEENQYKLLEKKVSTKSKPIRFIYPRSAAVEDDVSAAAQVLTARRCKLTDETIDTLIFLRPRMKAEGNFSLNVIMSFLISNRGFIDMK